MGYLVRKKNQNLEKREIESGRYISRKRRKNLEKETSFQMDEPRARGPLDLVSTSSPPLVTKPRRKIPTLCR